MIVYSTAPLVIGRRYEHDVIDDAGDAHRVPFVVLREATRDEWLAWTADAEKKERWLAAHGHVGLSYYEVSMD